MRIAVFSDTHVADEPERLGAAFWNLARNADAVVHLGDFTGWEVLARLKECGPFYGVHGNRDEARIERELPRARTIEFHGVRCLAVHHFRGADAAGPARSDAEVVLCGHTHRPQDTVLEGMRILNPGAAGDGARNGGRRTAGVLTVADGRVDWEVVVLSAKGESIG